ncbi:hypothetical protein OAV88_01290, partial [bacterium]|nr:hypothetical protein [bacterium]
ANVLLVMSNARLENPTQFTHRKTLQQDEPLLPFRGRAVLDKRFWDGFRSSETRSPICALMFLVLRV